MQVKTFEIRDRATFIPALAVRLTHGHTPQDNYLMRRAGFSNESLANGEFVVLTRLEGGTAHYDPFEWPVNPRTMQQAHFYIAKNWDSLPSGAVVDVEFILGESKMMKVSEAVSDP